MLLTGNTTEENRHQMHATKDTPDFLMATIQVKGNGGQSDGKYTCCHQIGHAGSNTLLQQNPPLRRCQLKQADLYMAIKMVVVTLSSWQW